MEWQLRLEREAAALEQRKRDLEEREAIHQENTQAVLEVRKMENLERERRSQLEAQRHNQQRSELLSSGNPRVLNRENNSPSSSSQ